MEEQAVNATISGLTRKKRKKVICPYCKGEGVIEQRKFYGYTDGWINSRRRCEICEGSKILERITRVEYKVI